ncbi:MAG: glutamine-synthetase adenylyltransferase, partial [Pseudomonadota bacterium]
ALSAETAEGSLYETDMRLRPSGRAGPVATSLASFDRYQKEQAWTWEHMALTRLRILTGDDALGHAVERVAQAAINSDTSATRTSDILDMRARMMREKPATGPWDLKLRRGGLVDIEFITQHAILTAEADQNLCPNLSAAQKQLRDGGIWSADDYETLTDAYAFLQALLQVQRMAHQGIAAEQDLSHALEDRLCRAVGCEGFSTLLSRLEATCARVTEKFAEKIGVLATET